MFFYITPILLILFFIYLYLNKQNRDSRLAIQKFKENKFLKELIHNLDKAGYFNYVLAENLNHIKDCFYSEFKNGIIGVYSISNKDFDFKLFNDFSPDDLYSFLDNKSVDSTEYDKIFTKLKPFFEVRKIKPNYHISNEYIIIENKKYNTFEYVNSLKTGHCQVELVTGLLNIILEKHHSAERAIPYGNEGQGFIFLSKEELNVLKKQYPFIIYERDINYG